MLVLICTTVEINFDPNVNKGEQNWECMDKLISSWSWALILQENFSGLVTSSLMCVGVVTKRWQSVPGAPKCHGKTNDCSIALTAASFVIYLST